MYQYCFYLVFLKLVKCGLSLKDLHLSNEKNDINQSSNSLLFYKRTTLKLVGWQWTRAQISAHSTDLAGFHKEQGGRKLYHWCAVKSLVGLSVLPACVQQGGHGHTNTELIMNSQQISFLITDLTALTSLWKIFCLWFCCDNSPLFECLWSHLWELVAPVPQKALRLLPHDGAIYCVKGFKLFKRLPVLMYILKVGTVLAIISSFIFAIISSFIQFFTSCLTLDILFSFFPPLYLILAICLLLLVFSFLPVFHYFKGFFLHLSPLLPFLPFLYFLSILFLLFSAFCSSVTLWQWGAATRSKTSCVTFW